MKNSPFIILTLTFLIINISLAGDLRMLPIAYASYKSQAGTWNTNVKQPATVWGLGIQAETAVNRWFIEGKFIFNSGSSLGRDPFAFSPEQGIEFSQGYRESEGFWWDYSTLKATWRGEELQLEVGKFSRHWGPGVNALLVSSKPPSYPQFGFDWQITPRIKLTYFHGFLRSQIADTLYGGYYDQVGKKGFEIARSVAAHRLEWKLLPQLVLGASEAVVYATRSIDPAYLIPFVPFWSTQHYLGDTDNVLMCGDITWLFNPGRRIYGSLFMDEWTPEWTFEKNNRNWFGWLAGFVWTGLVMPSDILRGEFTWTDHRIYRHRFSINDVYHYGDPLGFWAGPHAEELFLGYSVDFKAYKLIIRYSDAKRGELTKEMLKNQYGNIIMNQRYSGPVDFEQLQNFEILVHRYVYNRSLKIELGLNHVIWKNAGYDPFDPDPDSLKDIRKTSFVLGFSYNFDYLGRNRGLE